MDSECAQAGFVLRADFHPFDVRTENVDEEGVALVPPSKRTGSPADRPKCRCAAVVGHQVNSSASAVEARASTGGHALRPPNDGPRWEPAVRRDVPL